MQFFHPPIFHSISPLSAFILPEESYERLPETLAGLHWVAFIFLMLASTFHKSA
jgi:hypothetical protein